MFDFVLKCNILIINLLLEIFLTFIYFLIALTLTLIFIRIKFLFILISQLSYIAYKFLLGIVSFLILCIKFHYCTFRCLRIKIYHIALFVFQLLFWRTFFFDFREIIKVEIGVFVFWNVRGLLQNLYLGWDPHSFFWLIRTIQCLFVGLSDNTRVIFIL
jgi:hypothetical protein